MDDDLLGTTITCFAGILSAERADRRTPLRLNRARLIVGQPPAGSSDPFRLGHRPRQSGTRSTEPVRAAAGPAALAMDCGTR